MQYIVSILTSYHYLKLNCLHERVERLLKCGAIEITIYGYKCYTDEEDVMNTFTN